MICCLCPSARSRSAVHFLQQAGSFSERAGKVVRLLQTKRRQLDSLAPPVCQRLRRKRPDWPGEAFSCEARRDEAEREQSQCSRGAQRHGAPELHGQFRSRHVDHDGPVGHLGAAEQGGCRDAFGRPGLDYPLGILRNTVDESRHPLLPHKSVGGACPRHVDAFAVENGAYPVCGQLLLMKDVAQSVGKEADGEIVDNRAAPKYWHIDADQGTTQRDTVGIQVRNGWLASGEDPFHELRIPMARQLFTIRPQRVENLLGRRIAEHEIVAATRRQSCFCLSIEGVQVA